MVRKLQKKIQEALRKISKRQSPFKDILFQNKIEKEAVPFLQKKTYFQKLDPTNFLPNFK